MEVFTQFLRPYQGIIIVIFEPDSGQFLVEYLCIVLGHISSDISL